MQLPFEANCLLQPSKIHLPDEDPATVESFLEFLYTKEYFPRLIANSARKRLEADEDIPNFDDTGAQLLRHAKVYTIAKKFGIEELCQLAFAKIHLVDSSPSAEIAYARYVYQSTSSDDATIRSPVKFYWASQSHELRHEVQKEFRQMCTYFHVSTSLRFELTLSHRPRFSRVRLRRTHFSSGPKREAKATTSYYS